MPSGKTGRSSADDSNGKHCKKHRSGSRSSNGSPLHAKLFAFFDKTTGARRFEVRADERGRLPLEEAVSLLAVQCILHHQMPADFSVMIGVESDLIGGLAGRTTKLIEKCSLNPAATSQMWLTRRESEVLAAVRERLSNKEIASRLNLSERTVKFHVSSLLQKFQVRGRMDLLPHWDKSSITKAQRVKSDLEQILKRRAGDVPTVPRPRVIEPIFMPRAKGTSA